LGEIVSGIILPEHVRLQLDFENQLETLNKRHDWLRHFDAELQRLDPYLSLVKASESADQAGLTPGFWHVQRKNPETMPTYIPLTDDKGGFAEPQSHHLEMLRRADLQRPGAFEEFKRRQDERVREMERRKADQAEQRRTEIAERISHLDVPKVSMSDGWTNSVRGKKARK
jgi:hypothetical protein